MKIIYTEYLTNGEVRFTTSPFTEDWPKFNRKPRVEILSDGQVWMYHEQEGVYAWSIINNIDKAINRLIEET